jgi:hypothetical protein
VRGRDEKIACRIHKWSVNISRLSETGARWLMDSGGREFIIVLIVMGVLLVFAIAAVIIFVRVWRKERK